MEERRQETRWLQGLRSAPPFRVLDSFLHGNSAQRRKLCVTHSSSLEVSGPSVLTGRLYQRESSLVSGSHVQSGERGTSG